MQHASFTDITVKLVKSSQIFVVVYLRIYLFSSTSILAFLLSITKLVIDTINHLSPSVGTT